MTPKEKAIELVDKYKNLEIKLSHFVNDYLFGGDIIIKMKDNQSKQCALIAVDEILKAITNYEDIDYWHAVKQEIEKL